ncbi:hypothetical protein K435DRAFT_850018 [Dendrothele bispora CBS 962.96]|uniref:Uncharacterized protein n=1 Tax=Dendrothele bispora (strain CBS 962.96) TaxID=1314807 RepID=A0A4S8MQW2_DENBC|nr:hypothetical protein K435DRAFT_850018 [Dendrothele bispora CBS 962.96]
MSVHHQRTLSTDSTSSEYSVNSYVDHPSPRRKQSEGGSDRRRIAVVQIQAEVPGTQTQDSPTGIALVAPPDASPSSYSSHHTRSASEANKSRELSVIGPHFLKPESRSPSMKTPDVGSEKPIDDPVAGPVVDYLNYQLGQHATAGPLPLPPRASAPPRSPMRDLDAVKQALQLPQTVQAALASAKSPSPTTSSHRREAAFTPATTASTFITPSAASGPASASDPVSGLPSSSSDHPIPFVKQPSPPPKEEPVLEEAEPESESSPEPSPEPSIEVEVVASPPSSSHSHSSYSHDTPMSISSPPASSLRSSSTAPSPPPKSLRHSLTKSLKRMSASLPKTPPLSPSNSRTPSLDLGVPLRRSLSRSRSRTPSPSHHPTISIHTNTNNLFIQSSPQLPPPLPPHPSRQQRPRKRIKVSPGIQLAALSSYEVPRMKNANERCEAYARKINELYIYDSGLMDWLWNVGYGKNSKSTTTLSPIPASPNPLQQLDSNGNPNPNYDPDYDPTTFYFESGSGLAPHQPSYPSTFPSSQHHDPSSFHPRQVSSSSANSDVTFPRRPDASLATDLTMKEKDKENLALNQPGFGTPNVPYPSLPSYHSSSFGSASSGRSGKGKASLSLFSGSGSTNSSVGSHTPPGSGSFKTLQLPGTTPTKTGFFATLGRKASINKRGGGSSTDGHEGLSSSGAKLTKSPPGGAIGGGGEPNVNGNTISSPISGGPIIGTPNVPGGPRAIPGKFAAGPASAPAKGINPNANLNEDAKMEGAPKDTSAINSNARRIGRSQTMMVNPGSGWLSDSPVTLSSMNQSGGRGKGFAGGPRALGGVGAGVGMAEGGSGGHMMVKKRPSLYDIPSSDYLPENEMALARRGDRETQRDGEMGRDSDTELDLAVKSDSGHTYSNYTYPSPVSGYQQQQQKYLTHGQGGGRQGQGQGQSTKVVARGPRSPHASLVPAGSKEAVPTTHRQQSSPTAYKNSDNSHQHQSLQLATRPGLGPVSTSSTTVTSNRSGSSHSSYSGYSSSQVGLTTSAGAGGVTKQITFQPQLQPSQQSQTQSLTLSLAKQAQAQKRLSPSSTSTPASQSLTRAPKGSSYPSLARNSNSSSNPNSYSYSSPKSNANASSNNASNPESTWPPDFVRQVDKLHDLLPHAERQVLAGYLRRAGQDILAIGQYLEDEKCGRIRRD